MNKLVAALNHKNTATPPLWLMRQAGRYHSHYQNFRNKHTFVELCKNPKLACEVTLGPVRAFDFDAAILFSDILFPLEALGFGLNYENGPPKLAWLLTEQKDLNRISRFANFKILSFQSEALKLIRQELDSSKGLIGFVGGPLTLFYYACLGSHKNPAKLDLDNRFEGFCDRLLPLLAQNIINQALAGPDVLAVFDTCAGELDETSFKEKYIPILRALLKNVHSKVKIPILYYSKGTNEKYWKALWDLPITALGIDWNHHLPTVLKEFGGRFSIQGNIDPHWLLLNSQELEVRLRDYFNEIKRYNLSGWICGLGHGVLPNTPEENVRLLVRLQREIFGNTAYGT